MSFVCLCCLFKNESSITEAVCLIFSAHKHMVKMSKRGQHSAVQEIRAWTTEHIEKILADVSFSYMFGFYRGNN